MAAELAVRNGEVLLPDGRRTVADVLIREGRIAEIGPGLKARDEVDASGAYVLPGLIDIHTHGMAGVGLEDDLSELSKRHAERGATTFFPTLWHSTDDAVELMKRHRSETDELRAVPQVGGFRLEWPYLADDGGAIGHELSPITRETTDALLAAGGGHVRLWDISPELNGAAPAIAELSERGIVCSICHTHCTVAQGRAAVEAGARLATHLFDVFFLPESDDPDEGVYPAGVVDYLLIEDRVVCEIIGDGTHVDPMLVEKAFRCKTPERLAFITDSSQSSGLPPGTYTMAGSQVVIRGVNEGVRVADTMFLAGSALSPIDAFRNVVQLFGKGLAAAVQVCSATPARLLGLNKGALADGRDGDVIVVGQDLDLRCVIAGGSVVHTA